MSMRAYLELRERRLRARVARETFEKILDYKKGLQTTIRDLEKTRLEDLKSARDIVFKYALPSSILESFLGAVIALVSQTPAWIIPTILLVIVTFSLAYNLDLRKTVERQDIMEISEDALTRIEEQVNDLIIAGVVG